MMKNIQNPQPLLMKILGNILDASRLSFDYDQGLVNAKDLQTQCLFEYERLKSKQSKKKKTPIESLGLQSMRTRAKKNALSLRKKESFEETKPALVNPRSNMTKRVTLFGLDQIPVNTFSSKQFEIVSEEDSSSSGEDSNTIFYSVDKILNNIGNQRINPVLAE